VCRKEEDPNCFQMVMVPLDQCDGPWSECSTDKI
jgi:hypothetical protein